MKVHKLPKRSAFERISVGLIPGALFAALLTLGSTETVEAKQPGYAGRWVLAPTPTQAKLREKVELTVEHGPGSACGTLIETKDRSKKPVSKRATCTFQDTGPGLFVIVMTAENGEVEKYEFRVEKSGKSAQYTPYKDGQRNVTRSLSFVRLES